MFINYIRKKLVTVFVIISLPLLVFQSCVDYEPIEPAAGNQVSASNMAALEIYAFGSRTALPSGLCPDIILMTDFSLTGTRTGSTEKISRKWESQTELFGDNVLYLSTGNWTFSLSAKYTDETNGISEEYESKITKEILSEGSNIVSFVLIPKLSTGEGSLNVEISFPNNDADLSNAIKCATIDFGVSGAGAVDVTSSVVEVPGDTTRKHVKIENKKLNAGYHRITLRLYRDTEKKDLINVFTYGAVIARGFTTDLTESISDLNQKYRITYDANGGTFSAGTTTTQDFNTLENVTLLSGSKCTKNGIVAASWNTKSDGSGTSYTTGWSAGDIGANITLYAIYSLTVASLCESITAELTSPAFDGTITLPSSSDMALTPDDMLQIKSALNPTDPATGIPLDIPFKLDMSAQTSLTSVPQMSFMALYGLTEVKLPSQITSIEMGAFYGCKNLSSISIPDGTQTISDNSFYGCENLTTVNLPSSVTAIGNKAFGNCKKLQAIDLSNVQSMDSGAFINCESLTSADISSVSSLASNASIFGGCTSLSELTLPRNSVISNVSSIGNTVPLSTIKYPGTLKEYMESDASLKWLVQGGSYPAGGVSLEVLDSGSYVPVLDIDCSSLSLSTFKLEKLSGMYLSSLNLRGITNLAGSISDVVEAQVDSVIMEGGLDTCPATLLSVVQASDISFYGTLAQWNSCPVELYSGISSFSMNGNPPASADFAAAGITQVKNYCFYNCSSLVDVNFSGVTNVGESAFAKCTNLEGNIDLSSCEIIGKSAFSNCKNISPCVLDLSSIVTINNSAFAGAGPGCFTEVKLGSSLVSMGKNSFSNCKIPVVKYSGTASGWNSVSEKDLETNVAECSMIFDGCTEFYMGTSKVTDLNITSADMFRFRPYYMAYYESLVSIQYTSISQRTFDVGEKAFYNCKNLSDISELVSGSKTQFSCSNVDSMAFKNTDLNCSIVLKGTIGDEAFSVKSGTSGVFSNIYIDSSSVTFGKNVFGSNSVIEKVSDPYNSDSDHTLVTSTSADFSSDRMTYTIDKSSGWILSTKKELSTTPLYIKIE